MGHCLALHPREHLLLQVSIKCNHKRGIWYLWDNSVECTDTGCITCLDKSQEERTMTRCGAGGFGKHSGLSAESIWKSAFKVDVAGLSLAVSTCCDLCFVQVDQCLLEFWLTFLADNDVRRHAC